MFKYFKTPSTPIFNFTFLLLLLILTTIPSYNSYKVSDFTPSILKASPPSGYYNIQTGTDIQGQILCFGDLNGDQYHDYIAYSKNKPLILLIYFWNSDRSQFVLDSLSLTKYNGIIGIIQQVMIADLSDDGSQQIIITYSKYNNSNGNGNNNNGNNGNNNKIYETIVYKILNCGYMVCTYQQFILNGAGLNNMSTVPTLINIQGSSTSFLIFQGTSRYIVQKQSSNIYVKKQFSEILNSQNKPTTYRKVDKHYTSNIDYNGDCHSDLVILSKNQDNSYILQFYTKQTNSRFNLQKQLAMGYNIKFVTFIDFDTSGTVDIVLIIGQSHKQKTFIIYNLYTQLKQICKKFQQFPYDIKNAQLLPLPLPQHSQLSQNSILSFGDIDSDSYPDLLTIIIINDFRKVVLYKNIQKDGNRYLQQSKQYNTNLIYEMKNPRQVVFFDLGQDGKLDIFVMVQEEKNSQNISVITRTCFINNVKDDTLFIKIWPLSQTSTYQAGSNRLASAYGITIQWRITKLDGNKKISLLNQKTQWNYGTLQLPFITGGLGRTNNYVQDLTVGYQDVGQKMNWSPIIPNSKLLVYQKNNQWKLQTLLTNNQRVNHVIYVSVVILFVLGLVIFFLNYRENQEDKKDQYNFIQLIR